MRSKFDIQSNFRINFLSYAKLFIRIYIFSIKTNLRNTFLSIALSYLNIPSIHVTNQFPLMATKKKEDVNIPSNKETGLSAWYIIIVEHKLENAKIQLLWTPSYIKMDSFLSLNSLTARRLDIKLQFWPLFEGMNSWTVLA